MLSGRDKHYDVESGADYQILSTQTKWISNKSILAHLYKMCGITPMNSSVPSGAWDFRIYSSNAGCSANLSDVNSGSGCPALNVSQMVQHNK